MSDAARKPLVSAAALLGALLLLISLFLDWYEVKATEGVPEGITDSIAFSGWTALEFADGFLVFAALAAAWLAIARWRGNAGTNDATLLGALALLTTSVVLVLFFTKTSVLAMATSAIDLAEEEGAGNVPVDISTKLGAIIALLGALSLLAAAIVDRLPARAAQPAAAGAMGQPGYGAPAGGGAMGQPGYGAPAGGGAATPAGAPAQTWAAGWYPDPQRQANERYWDGSQWTSHTR